MKIDRLRLKIGNFRLPETTFDFGKKGLVFISGENGSGKTSLMRALLGRIRIQSGEISDLPKPIAAIGVEGFLFQNWTFEENISSISALLGQRPKITDFFNQMKNEKIKDLSLGWKRRAELEVLNIFQFPLILLDEPLSPLDAEARSILSKQIEKFRKDSLILMTAHEGMPISFNQELRLSK